MTRSVEASSSVYMVEGRESELHCWFGRSIHLTEAAAIAVCGPDERVTPFAVSNAAQAVSVVSSRLRGEHKKHRAGAEAVS